METIVVVTYIVSWLLILKFFWSYPGPILLVKLIARDAKLSNVTCGAFMIGLAPFCAMILIYLVARNFVRALAQQV
jgi:hypothetical protein